MNSRTEERRRARDVAFLELLTTASLEELLMMRRAHLANGPKWWKLVAIERAITKRTK